MAGHRPWSELKRDMSPERRAHVNQLYQQKRIGLLVAELRKQAGLTQTQLAERIGTGQSTISQMEASGDMHVTTLNKIIRELGGEIIIHTIGRDVNLTHSGNE